MAAFMGNPPGNRLGQRVWTIAMILGVSGSPALGQSIVPDGSLGAESSRVDSGPIDRISGGAQRGTSLFHSFTEFNVLDGQRVYFGNPIGVANIFSRVTGGNASAIDGTLGVAGSANLFLLNPNGILFGPNARLDIPGSFMASTAPDWRFVDGSSFSAVTANAAPLLEVGLTPGLQLGRGQGNIEVNSLLQVGGNVILDARNIAIDGGLDVSPVDGLGNPSGDGGQIELVAVNGIDLASGSKLQASGLRGGGIAIATPGRLSATSAGILSNSVGETGKGGEIILRAGEIDFDETVVATNTGGGTTGGDITVIADEMRLTNGSQIQSFTVDSGAGGSVLVVADRLTIDGVSRLQDSDGNGFIDLSTRNNPIGGLSSGIIVSTEEPSIPDPGNPVTGNAGNLRIQADRVTLSNGAVLSSRSRSLGRGGEIALVVGDLNILNGGQIIAPAYSSGDAGNIGITASRGITIEGIDPDFTDRKPQIKTALLKAGLSEERADQRTEFWVDPIVENSGIIIDDINGLGKPGGLLLGSPSLTMGAGALISSNSRGAQDAGTIALSVQDLELSGGAKIVSATFGSGKGGNVVIVPQDEFQPSSVTIDGVAEFAPAGAVDVNGNATGGFSSGIIVNAEDGDEGPGVTTGTGGNLLISTTNLTLSNGGVLTARSQNGGNGGDMLIDVDRAELTSGGQIVLSTFSSGNGGRVLLNANQTIVAEGVDDTRKAREDQLTAGFEAFFSAQVPALDPITIAQKAKEKTDFTLDTVSSASGIVANVETGGSGTGGFIFATAMDSIELKDSAEIAASTFGSGDSGNILLQADRINFDDGDIRTIVEGGATGNGGEIVVIGNSSITLSGGSQIASAVFRAEDGDPGGKGDAGQVSIKAPDILIEGRNDRDFKSGLFASTEKGAEGNGGAIFVEADRLTIRDDGLINASTSNTFNGGSIDIELTGQLTIADGGSIIADGDANILNAGNPGNILITANNIVLRDGGKISAITDSGANANIALTLNRGIVFPGQDSEISTDAQGPGNGGSIFIRLGSDILTDLDANNDIVATSVGGRGGRIVILNGPTAKVETFRIAEKGVRRTPQSDLTASSDIDQNGTIFIAADAAGLIRPSLPVLPDRPPQVSQTCKATTIAKGEFFITGRGGLPTDPSDRRVSFEPLSDWSKVSSVVGSAEVGQGVAYVPPGDAARSIEATGWDGRTLGRGAAMAWDWWVPCLEAIEDRGANSAQ
jgi:filamentous hemagglutinin family protein